MKIRLWHKILLSIMILWDATLHWVEILGLWESYPFYPYFPLWGISYDLFWTTFWTIGFLLSILIIFGRKK